MDIDIVKLKEYAKDNKLVFFIKDGYIYCEDTTRGERVIVGNYACIELNARALKIVYENGLTKYEFNDETRILKTKQFLDYNFLTSLGFKLREDGHYIKKVYLKNDNDDRNFYDINPQTCELKADIQHYLDNTLLSLCLGGILE